MNQAFWVLLEFSDAAGSGVGSRNMNLNWLHVILVTHEVWEGQPGGRVLSFGSQVQVPSYLMELGNLRTFAELLGFQELYPKMGDSLGVREFGV